MTAEVATPSRTEAGPLAVFRNSGFLRLWLSQASTQIGGNMVLFGLTIIVSSSGSKTAVSILILTFLVPAVLFSAVAGVYVDRIDRRLILIATNLLRGLAFVALYLAGTNLAVILLLNVAISTITVFFAPAELAMIPVLVPRSQLLAANGIFTLTLNAAFALGFALLGPLVVKVAGPEAVIVVVAGLYFLAAIFCITLPASPPPPSTEESPHSGLGVGEASGAMGSTLGQLQEGFTFIRGHRAITWSLIYLALAASLVGVLGVLGPAFAQETLGLKAEDFAVVVLPLGFGIVTGILLLNSYGRYFHRRRVIEVALIALGILLAALAAAGPISRLLQRADQPGGLDLSGVTSLLAVVVVIAFFAGIAYGLVAIPAQTGLQEDLPEDVRGRVFGVLGMLVSVASFLPIIIVGPISDLVGTTAVIFVSAIAVMVVGIVSVLTRGPLAPDASLAADPHAVDPIASALGADLPTWTGHPDDPSDDAAPVTGPVAPVPTPETVAETVAAGRADRVGPGHRRRSARARPDRPIRPDRPGLSPMGRVAVVFTGGTISTAFDPVAGGNVPILDGAAILARTPGLDAVADVVAIDRGRTPASHFTFPELLDIADVVRSALADPAIDGAVIVQGTDTIEETAFCWDLVLDDPKPVVVTGAMRASDDAGFDGPANLRDAVRVATSDPMRGTGVVVCLAGTIEPADDVIKMHASALDTFQSPNGGSLGRVTGDGLVLYRRTRRPAPRPDRPSRRAGPAHHRDRRHGRLAARRRGRGRGGWDRRRRDGRREHGSVAPRGGGPRDRGRHPGRPCVALSGGSGRRGVRLPGWGSRVDPGGRAPGRPSVRGQGPGRARARARCRTGSRRARRAAGRSGDLIRAARHAHHRADRHPRRRDRVRLGRGRRHPGRADRLRRLRGRARDARRPVHRADRARARRGGDPGPHRRAPAPRRRGRRDTPGRPVRCPDPDRGAGSYRRRARGVGRSGRLARGSRLGRGSLGPLAHRRRSRDGRAGASRRVLGARPPRPARQSGRARDGRAGPCDRRSPAAA